MYRALVGRPPFQGDSEVATALKHLHEDPLPLRSIKAGIPRALDSAVLRALAKDPDDRYASASEMQRSLTSAVGGRSEMGTQVIRQPTPAPALSPDEDAPGFVSSEVKRIVPIVILVLLAVAVVVLALGLTEEETPEARSPGRNEQNEGGSGGGGGGSVIKVSSVTDFDPHGGDGENAESAPLAVDGDGSTAWETSSYNDQLSLIKPGVGLLFDLGSSTEVSEVEVKLATAGVTFELRAAGSAGADEQAFDLIDTVEQAGPTSKVDAGGEASRYWLMWITDLPGGGGGRASVAEVTFFGP